jgi:hypothetical protein
VSIRQFIQIGGDNFLVRNRAAGKGLPVVDKGEDIRLRKNFQRREEGFLSTADGREGINDKYNSRLDFIQIFLTDSAVACIISAM